MANYTGSGLDEFDRKRNMPEALGQSETFLDFQSRLSAVAKVERPVLIVGERGTGKELAAARLHFLSGRWENPMISLNCAALSRDLIESELFGHEQGAFTGAAGRRQGRFEMADGGSLFLDELGLMPMAVQEKVLRVTEYGTFERVGGSKELRVDVRLIGATNADLSAMARDGTFKEDLLDRLAFEVLHLPPLRSRIGDIPLLAGHFASRMALELGMDDVPEISDALMAQMESFPWPGNVRQLKNVVERAVYQSGGKPIRHLDFDPLRSPWMEQAKSSAVPASPFGELDGVLESEGLEAARTFLERKALETALSSSSNQSEAAEKLRLGYNQFRALYRKYKA